MTDRIRTGLWVRFTDDGIPAWFGPAWVEGAEWVEGIAPETLITHRRVDGVWTLREPEPPPSPEDIATMEAERAAQEAEAAEAAREEAIDAAIAASPAYRKFLRGEMTLTAYRDAAAAIAAQFPKA
jgi:hypothetical protein